MAKYKTVGNKVYIKRSWFWFWEEAATMDEQGNIVHWNDRKTGSFYVRTIFKAVTGGRNNARQNKTYSG